MKQKIIIRVQMNCEKCRIKAMKIASNTYGVISVAVEGSDKDHLVVIGEGVHSANLTGSLRKKLSYGAAILSVEEVKEKEKKAEEKEKPKEDKNPNNPEEHVLVFHQYSPVPMFCEVYDPVPSFCSIM
ncbi:heavy metal-associated isoprenylated plant protein 47-like isoform X1 [Castanea sativa]|uniref:heavy metal-associated isoprenylated plant protein 47-like isoform X1 n=1 Tax=Castanea sativa TaxID=21020 RepID=UPI003F653336